MSKEDKKIAKILTELAQTKGSKDEKLNAILMALAHIIKNEQDFKD